ncbi:MAG TPA: MnhB domain-containing protein [Ilumatobacteraceae bacterium]|nr:MnhB domain-containing protein [Ilumatobacteraceae bacterium]
MALAVSAVTPIALLIAAYALFVGHNQPGGGFAAGLLLGAVLVLRTVAGLQEPKHAAVLLALGGIIVGVDALSPLLWGEPLLDQFVVSWDVPVLGTVKTGSALVFDLGVVAVVVGLVIALLEGFGASDLAERGRTPTDAQMKARR